MNPLESRVVEALRTIYDPEIPVNIYDLGLIYSLGVDSEGRAQVTMTLTAPSCPEAGALPGYVEAKLREIPGIEDVSLQLIWDPPWAPSRMSDAAKLALGFDL